jgi:predicted nucleic acid-binding protein
VADRETVLLDTDLLIDYLRGRKRAIAYVEKLTVPLLVSAISVAELAAGLRGEDEERALESFLLAFVIVPVDGDAARRGGAFRRRYGPSHGTGLADALIAAAAYQRGATLVTLNTKHFPMLTEIRRPYR